MRTSCRGTRLLQTEHALVEIPVSVWGGEARRSRPGGARRHKSFGAWALGGSLIEEGHGALPSEDRGSLAVEDCEGLAEEDSEPFAEVDHGMLASEGRGSPLEQDHRGPVS